MRCGLRSWSIISHTTIRSRPVTRVRGQRGGGELALWAPGASAGAWGCAVEDVSVDGVNKAAAKNLVFLIDVSGSMQAANKLPLLKESMKMLVRELGGPRTR